MGGKQPLPPAQREFHFLPQGFISFRLPGILCYSLECPTSLSRKEDSISWVYKNYSCSIHSSCRGIWRNFRVIWLGVTLPLVLPGVRTSCSQSPARQTKSHCKVQRLLPAHLGDSRFKSTSGAENMHFYVNTGTDYKNWAVNLANSLHYYSLLNPVLKFRLQGAFSTKKEMLWSWTWPADFISHYELIKWPPILSFIFKKELLSVM